MIGLLAAMAVGAILTMYAHGDFKDMRPVSGGASSGSRRKPRKHAAPAERPS